MFFFGVNLPHFILLYLHMNAWTRFIYTFIHQEITYSNWTSYLVVFFALLHVFCLLYYCGRSFIFKTLLENTLAFLRAIFEEKIDMEEKYISWNFLVFLWPLLDAFFVYREKLHVYYCFAHLVGCSAFIGIFPFNFIKTLSQYS